MRITVNPTLDMDTLEFISNDGEYEYDGPAMLFDRSMQNSAGKEIGQANTTAAQLGANGQSTYGMLQPTLGRWLTSPPGFSPADLSNMQARQQEAANATSAAAEQQAKLRALRSGNPAGIQASQDAVAQAASRAQGTGIQNVQAQNAALKAKQQGEAASGLEGLYGTDTSGMLRAMGLVPEDIEAGVNAGKSGWLQNAEGVFDTLSGMGKNAAGAYKALYG